jgi:hypothetical protein
MSSSCNALSLSLSLSAFRISSRQWTKWRKKEEAIMTQSEHTLIREMRYDKVGRMNGLALTLRVLKDPRKCSQINVLKRNKRRKREYHSREVENGCRDRTRWKRERAAKLGRRLRRAIKPVQCCHRKRQLDVIPSITFGTCCNSFQYPIYICITNRPPIGIIKCVIICGNP